MVCAVAVALLLPGLVSPAGAAESGLPPTNTTAPTVLGTPRVGELLSSTTGLWEPEPASYEYSWLRDHLPISGAHQPTYRLTAADQGKRIAVQVTGIGSDSTSGAPSSSSQTAVVGPGLFRLVTRPVITGVRRWDHTLTASPGTWSPQPSTVVYQWLRDGRAISGATKASYAATVADFGHHLAVRVSARRASYANGVTISPRTGLIDHRVRVKKRFTYRIATRGRITADLQRFAALTAASYADPRGWRAAGFRFTRVARGGDFTLVLSSAAKLPSFGFPCSSTWSCRVGRYVIINQTRWQHASPAWNAANRTLREYRHMVLNHETGHWLGHRHSSCPGQGRLAPIMMPQSKGLDGCRFNPFPLPRERTTSR